jgi:hypothetical protein
MSKKHRSPVLGEGSGTQLEVRWSSRGWPWQSLRAVVAVVLGLQVACATSYPMGATLTGTGRSWRRGGGAQLAAELPREDLEVTNLRRAAKLPWMDGGRCVVEAAGQSWPELVESPPAPTDRERDRKCEAIPVPHSGGNKAHDKCADWYPPNRWPGMDARVDGRDFDALQVGVRVLWEIKVENFDEYSDFLKEITVKKEIKAFTEYRDIALACGYAFKVGVSSEAHKAALLEEDDTFDIVVTGCKR